MDGKTINAYISARRTNHNVPYVIIMMIILRGNTKSHIKNVRKNGFKKLWSWVGRGWWWWRWGGGWRYFYLLYLSTYLCDDDDDELNVTQCKQWLNRRVREKKRKMWFFSSSFCQVSSSSSSSSHSSFFSVHAPHTQSGVVVAGEAGALSDFSEDEKKIILSFFSHNSAFFVDAAKSSA